MFIGRTPAAEARKRRRAQQEEYAHALNKQVAEKEKRDLQSRAAEHAARYKKQFGLGRPETDEQSERASARGYLAGRGRGSEGLRSSLIDEFEERFQKVSRAFLAADADRSGFLDAGELRRLCSLYNLPADQVDGVLRLCDVDSDGKISYHEFSTKLSRPDYPTGPGGGLGLPGMPGIRRPAQGNVSPRYTNSLSTMWTGQESRGQSQVMAQRAKQLQYVRDLEDQIARRKAREQRAKQLDEEAAARAEREASSYNPWGRGGCGAPLRDMTGQVVTDLREVHEYAKVGGLSPPRNRGYASLKLQTTGREYHGHPNQKMYGSPSRLTAGAVAGGMAGAPQLQNSDMPQVMGASRLRFSTAGQEQQQIEYQMRSQKQQQLKHALSSQIEQKRREKALEKQRRLELERREDERVRREQEEIHRQYQLEHKAQQQKEKEVADANKAAAAAKQKAAKEAAVNVVNMKDPNSPEQIFRPQRTAARTPPQKRSPVLQQQQHSASYGSAEYSTRRGNSGGIAELRRDLIDQHSALLRKIEEQRSVVEVLRNQIQQFAGRGPPGPVAANLDYAAFPQNAGAGLMSQHFSSQAGVQMRGVGGLDRMRIANTGKAVLRNIDADDPDELDALLLDFVNRGI